nr:nucleoside-diphosphate sugar epimerase/dehydratase [Staphylococcus aureus]
MYHRAWEYASVSELILIVKAVTTSIVITMVVVTIVTGNRPFFRLYLITWMMHLILIGGSRLFWRIYRKYLGGKSFNKKPTLVVGAGQAGSMLIRQMLKSDEMKLEPVLAVDDDEHKRNITITEGVKVQGKIADIPELVRKYKIKKIIIAIPTIGQERLKEINNICHMDGVELLKMPNIEDVMSGELEVNQLKKVEVEDLLGRDPVELDMDMISNELTNKTILVTGAGGSIGSEICRQVCNFYPERIILLGHGENSIYLINRELRNRFGKNVDIVPIIADVQNRARMFEIMETYKPYAVYHAAAHKHVPLMEDNPEEAVHNNILGTKNTAEAAKNAEVKKFVMISTDKAVNPPNVMGASKRIAEMIIQINAMGISKAMMEKVFVAKSRNIRSEQTLICGTRYGNVMASRGSVIPLFIDKIKAGEPLTITDPDMTRFLMSLEDAVELVVHAFKHAETGDIMVQKAPSSTVGDLATALLELFEADNAIEIIGTRHGEKKAETLLTREEYAQCEDMGDYFRVPADSRDLNYSNYVETGNEKITQSYEYNSDNTHILTVEEIKEKLLTLEYVRNELNDYKASMR